MEKSNGFFRQVAAGFLTSLAAVGCGQNHAANCERMNILKTDDGFLVTENSNRILFYQQKPGSLDGKYTRANYVHPLYGLDGEILTEDFPADHLHHRGIFWAWHQVYVGDKRVGDGWSIENISWDVYRAKTLKADHRSAALQVEVFWKSPLRTDANGEQKPFVKETSIIRAYAVEADYRKIDFEISLLALEDGVRIGGAENEKAYGGFSARIRLPEGLSFTGSDGEVKPKGTPVEGGPWLDFSGRFTETDSTSGLAILCHKSNPGYPQLWVLRRSKSMQNAVYPGRYPVELSRQEPLVLRYRLIIHRGDAKQIDLDKLQAEYNAEKY